MNRNLTTLCFGTILPAIIDWVFTHKFYRSIVNNLCTSLLWADSPLSRQWAMVYRLRVSRQVNEYVD